MALWLPRQNALSADAHTNGLLTKFHDCHLNISVRLPRIHHDIRIRMVSWGHLKFGGSLVRTSIVAVRETGVSVGALAFSFFTLMMINAIIILPAGLILQDFLRAVI